MAYNLDVSDTHFVVTGFFRRVSAGLAELRQRFEEDKERIRRMKQARRGAEFG